MARQFVSASSQKLSVGSPIVTAAPLTIACWFYPTSTTGTEFLVSIVNVANSQYFALVRSGTTFESFTTAATVIGGTITTNRWWHGVGVWSSSTSRTVFLNGTQGNTSSVSVTPAGLARTTVGGLGSSSTNLFDGLIAVPCIWNVALTNAEVLLLAEGTPPCVVRPQNIAAYWPLNAPGVSLEFDATPGHARFHDLAVTGATPASNPPILRHPKIALQKRLFLLYQGTAHNTYNQTMTGGILGGGTDVDQAAFNPSITSAGVLCAGSGASSTYNQTMTGGILGGGTDVDRAAFNPSIGSAGVFGGGADLDRATFNPSIPSAGVLGAGSDVDQATFNPSITPVGVLGGSSGIVGIGPSIIPAGGLVGAADADQATFNPSIIAAGVLGGGSGIVSIGPSIMSAGVLAAGADVDQATFNPSITSAGLLGGGADIDQATYNPSLVTTGILAGGISIIGIAPYIAPSGILDAGADVDQASFNPSVSSAGLLAGSSGVPSIGPYIMPAGVLGGGGDMDLATFNPSVIPTGACGAGTASVLDNDTPSIASAGILGGGADVDQAAFNPSIVSAGILGGGEDVDQANFDPSVITYGVFGGGNGTITISLYIAPAGVLAGGADVDQAIFNPSITSVGLLGGGAEVVQTTCNASIVAAGTLGGGPDVEQAVFNPVVATDGVIAAGADVDHNVFNPSAVPAGVLAAGFAISSGAIYNEVAEGGVEMAGLADLGVTGSILVVLSGALLGGDSDQSFGVTNPYRYVYYRFLIGQLVFRYSFVTRAYQPGRIRATFLNGIDNYYDFGDGELVSERLIITPEEYRAQLGRKGSALRLDVARQKGKLQQIPQGMNPVGGLIKTVSYPRLPPQRLQALEQKAMERLAKIRAALGASQ